MNRRARALLLGCTISLLVPLAPARVEAQSQATPANRERAAALKKQGDEAMQSLSYADALASYNQSYALVPDPALLYNIGRAHEALDDLPAALDSLEKFDATAPAELKARVPKLSALIVELRGRVSSVTITANVAGARVLVRGRDLGTTPLPSAVRLRSGSATVEVTKEGHVPWKREVSLPGGGALTVDVTLSTKERRGTLVVGTTPPGAAVTVGGRDVGVSPAQVLVDAGAHEVVARREGYETARTSAVVAAGEKSEVNLSLQQERSITSRWWFWTGIGVVVVSGVVITTALLTERSADRGTLPPGQVSAPLVRFLHGSRSARERCSLPGERVRRREDHPGRTAAASTRGPDLPFGGQRTRRRKADHGGGAAARDARRLARQRRGPHGPDGVPLPPRARAGLGRRARARPRQLQRHHHRGHPREGGDRGARHAPAPRRHGAGARGHARGR